MHNVTIPRLMPMALSSMQKARCEHCPGRTNRMTVCNGTTLNVDNILGQTKVLGYRDGNGCECLVDFDALDICGLPASTFECLLDCRDRTQLNIPGSTAPTP